VRRGAAALVTSCPPALPPTRSLPVNSVESTADARQMPLPPTCAPAATDHSGQGVGSALVYSLIERAGGAPLYLTTIASRAAMYRRWVHRLPASTRALCPAADAAQVAAVGRVPSHCMLPLRMMLCLAEECSCGTASPAQCGRCALQSVPFPPPPKCPHQARL
jgi:hypothetical protein